MNKSQNDVASQMAPQQVVCKAKRISSVYPNGPLIKTAIDKRTSQSSVIEPSWKSPLSGNSRTRRVSSWWSPARSVIVCYKQKPKCCQKPRQVPNRRKYPGDAAAGGLERASWTRRMAPMRTTQMMAPLNGNGAKSGARTIARSLTNTKRRASFSFFFLNEKKVEKIFFNAFRLPLCGKRPVLQTGPFPSFQIYTQQTQLSRTIHQFTLTMEH